MEQIIGNSFLDQYFDEHTMSFHMKEGRPILRKKGTPGNWKPELDTKSMNKEEMNAFIQKIYEEIESRDDGFMEIDRKLSKVLQLGPYRIVIVYPPLSDGLEITIVKPINKLVMDDYKLDPEVFDLLRNKAKGILVSGSPGSGKTTFAQALIDVYHKDNHIIKTIESPRDLQVSDDIVQYSFTYGTHDEVRDILLLSRPDYTVYDEVRNKSDFELYKDLRLTGIGLVGVIHATRAVDSIQRFLGTIEMGIIPQVIDTVIYIDKGVIQEIFTLQLTVKVPEGMESEDLARPVIVITSFLTKQVEYEIYTFGEQIVVMPLSGDMNGEGKVQSKGKTVVSEYAKQTISKKLQQLLPCDFFLKVKGSSNLDLYIPEESKGRIIGKAGANINALEKSMGLKINLKSFDELPLLEVNTDIQAGKKSNISEVLFPIEFANQNICFLIGDQVAYFIADARGMITIKDKQLVKEISRRGFVVVDTNKL
ncbi:MAG: ATPase, T2SS/T4P/T4SS family [candidate division SR1 bacterium]|nr:ATPase, T2SS/T4P/T4SS family [candidate division SR1 bacterium]